MSAETNCRAVFLVGFMGAGKTSVGLELANRLGWRFLDLDQVVEERDGRTIAEIFRMAGEAAFREVEHSALIDVLHQLDAEPSVVALGGGAFVQARNAAAIQRAGTPVIFLDAPVEELYKRCAGKPGQRPLVQSLEQFRQLYETRRQGYMHGTLRVDTAGLTVEQVASAITQHLGLRESDECLKRI